MDKDGYAHIGISRVVILHDPSKDEKYDFVSKLTNEQIQFIQKHGKRVVRTYGKADVADVFRELNMGKLRELQESDDPYEVRLSHEIEYIILTNNSEHLNDERYVCESNGIMMQEASILGVFLSEATGRVSVQWRIATKSQESVAMWGILALPNDENKRSILQKWMEKNQRRVEEAKRKLERAKENIQRILGTHESMKKEGVEEV